MTIPVSPFSRRLSTVQRRRRGHARRRGVAMLLVLICLVVGTVMTAAALSSQNAAPAMGDNAADGAASAWAAESATDVAVAAMQTSANWVDGDSTLMTNFSIAGGTVSVTVTDLQGNAPAADDREVILTAVGRVGGMTTTVQKLVSITPAADLDGAIDPHLGEFTIFAKNKLAIDSGAMVTNWPASPEAKSSQPIKIGTGFASASDLNISSGAVLSGVEIYNDSNASNTLKSASDGAVEMADVIPLPVPAVPELLPNGLSSLLLLPISLNYTGVAASGTVASGARYLGLRVRSGAVVTLNSATATRYAFGNLVMDSASVLKVQGNVSIAVYGAISITDRANIELADASSSLTIYSLADVTIDNAGVAIPRVIAADTARSFKMLTQYVRPGSVKLLAVSTVSGGAANPTIKIKGLGLACMSIHAPTAFVRIENGSALIGRLTGGDVRLEAGGFVLADPLYDNRVAFTSKNGPMYKSDAVTPVDGLLSAITTFDSNSGAQALRPYLTATVALLDPVVMVVDGVLGGLLGESPPASPTPMPTARSAQRARASVVPESAMWLEGKTTWAQYDDDYSDR